MKLHPRTMIVRQAEQEFSRFLLDLIQKYDLTFAEQIRMHSEQISICCKYAIRSERHPDDPEKKATKNSTRLVAWDRKATPDRSSLIVSSSLTISWMAA